MHYPIFISYSRADGPTYAHQIRELFNRKGIGVWFDGLIEKGASFPSKIEEAITDCQIMILIVTPEACKAKSYVRKEFHFAKSVQKRIVPFLCMPIESVEVPKEWELHQRIDFINDPEEADKFASEISNQLDGKISYEESHMEQFDTTRRFLNKGKLLYSQGIYDQAAEAFRRAIIPAGSLAAIASYNLGQALYHLGQYRPAIEAYNQSLYYDVDSTNTWYNKGVALYKLKCYEDALAAFEIAIQKSANNADAWYNKGLTLEYLEQYEKALAACEHALVINPIDSDDIQETICQLKELVNKRKRYKKRWFRWLIRN